ncbi:MAG: hypothetical protein P8P83_00400 [Rickettsiaceae bacterium]|nr:hypothetical protein [Rickettsiaceae bacterium]
MIRKIILLISATLIIMWLVGAHVIKNKLISVISGINSDNIKFTYEDTRISGFPFNWQVSFISPKLIIIEQKSFKDISTPKLNVSFNYLMQGLKVNFGKSISYNKDKEHHIEEYNLLSTKDILLNLSFQKSIYLMNSDSVRYNIIDKADFSASESRAYMDNKEVLWIPNIQVGYNLVESDSIEQKNLVLKGEYNSSELFETKEGQLLVDLSWLSNNIPLKNSEEVDFEHKFMLSQFHINIDDAFCDAKGGIELRENSSPKGQFDVTMKKYSSIASLIIPKYFAADASVLNKFIEKSVPSRTQEDSESVKFKVTFSDQGIKVEQ